MTHANLTASALERAEKCPASCALPCMHVPSGIEAIRGSFIHAVLYWAMPYGDIACGIEEASHEYRRQYKRAPRPSWVKTAQAIEWQKILPDGVDENDIWKEAAFVYDGETDKTTFVGCNIGRNYPTRTDWHMAGTADVIAVNKRDGYIWVADYKTGRHLVSPDSLQLKFLGVMASAFVPGIDTVVLEVIHIGIDGSVQNSSLQIKKDELTDIKQSIVEIQKRVNEDRALYSRGVLPLVNPGGHCRYCGCKAVCPAIDHLQEIALWKA